MEPTPHDKILRFKDIRDRTGWSRATLHRRVDAGDFPRPVSLGRNCTGWRESEVNSWMANLPKIGQPVGQAHDK